MKASIKKDGPRVVLSYDDEDGERVERTFFSNGTYVYEDTRHGPKQVCYRLDRLGYTLMASKDNVLPVIRREYHAMKRALRKEAEAWRR